MRERLQSINHVVSTHGLGLLVGIEFDREASIFRDYLLENHIMTGTSSVPNVLRLLPPLTLQKAEIDQFLEVLGAFPE